MLTYQPIVAHVDGDIIRASLGVNDYFTRPAITFRARYGIPRAEAPSDGGEANGDSSMSAGPSTEVARADWLVGDKLDKALLEKGADRIDILWPFQHGQDRIDWEGREFVLSHMYSLLNIKPNSNTYPLLLVPPAAPATLPLSEQELYCQMAFENLNVPQLSMLPSPLAALFGLNASTGVVLHIGRNSSEAIVVTDYVVRWETATSVNIGEADCESHLEKLLLKDEALDKELKAAAEVDSWSAGQKEKLVKEIREFIFAECTGDDIEVPQAKTGAKSVVVDVVKPQEEEAFDVAKKLTADTIPQAPTTASHKSKKQQAAAAAAAASKASAAADAAAAAAAADVISVTIPSLPGKEVSVGPVRHRLCEPLISGISPGGDTAWEALGRAVENTTLSIPDRLLSWDAIAVTGDMARFRTFPTALVTYLSPYLLTSADLSSDSQPLRIRLLSIPDYITNFKGATSDLAPFLGASMVGKVVFGESQGKHSISKIDYNAHGPAAIYGVWQEAS